MTNDWPLDVEEMHTKFKVYPQIEKLSNEQLKELLEFRKSMIKEEVGELEDAKTAEDVVDALIDICVFAIGTLDLFDVDPHCAWNEVHQANMTKEPGVKEGRPNPFGFPDLIKPDGWRGPSHVNNHGLLSSIMDVENRK